MLDRCLFAIRLADPSASREIERRADRLVAFYRPLGPARLSLRRVDRAGLLAGVVDFSGGAHALDAPATFGDALPPALGRSHRLIAASDADLRALQGPLAALAIEEERARFVAAPGPTTLYAADARDIETWSTHAVAAVWLATGHARVDPAALPVFVAAEFVGGDASLVAGARAVPPATVVDVKPGGAVERSYWAERERWRLVPEKAAQRHAEEALVAALSGRCAGRASVACALTGGLDSRAAAAALRLAGTSFDSFTWGDPGWADATGAAAAAAALGASHRIQDPGWLADADAVPRVLAEARWTEGSRVEFSHATLPDGLDLLVTGGGGETGRSFYYRDEAARYRRPAQDQMVDHLVRFLQGRLTLAGPPPAVLRAAVTGWVGAARGAGLSGWRCLDHVYTEQRMRRWARQLMVRSSAGVAPAFTAPEVVRGLVSLPLAERLADGFHIRFLRCHLPGFDREVVSPPRPRLPGSIRRPAGRVKRLVTRAGPDWAAPPPLESKWEWRERPTLHAWVADDVLESPLLEEALGHEWLSELRRRFLDGDGQAEEIARWAGGPVALAACLHELN